MKFPRLHFTLSQHEETPADVARDHQITAAVEIAVTSELSRREAAARGAVLDALATAPTAAGAELSPIAEARASGALGDLSSGRTDDAVGAVVNQSFGVGRDDGADQITDADPNAIVAKVYSAVLDDGTCEECAQWDGATFPANYDSTPPGAVKAPNPRCAGTVRRCRCIWVYVHADEAPSIIGPDSGPMAVDRRMAGV